MLVSKIEKPLEKVHLIDSIIRLGVNYHFEDEIEDVLQHIYNDFVENGEITNFEDNLCSLAVLFRLLRQQGLYVSPSISSNLFTLIFFILVFNSSYIIIIINENNEKKPPNYFHNKKKNELIPCK
jgi:hypothetical protein